MQIIDGQKISQAIQQVIAKKIAHISLRKPRLAVIQVGENPASSIYVRKKIEACHFVGIHSSKYTLPEDASENALSHLIETLNQESEVDGILLQLPLPAHLNPFKFMEMISPLKDVDGFNPINMGRLLMGDKEGFVPCTPLGIQALLIHSGIEIPGKHVVIIGRSLTVGKPLAALLLQNTNEGNASVTVLHSKSEKIEEICQLADIIVVAIGSPLFLKQSMINKKAIIIDVGINRIEDKTKPSGYKIVGDADFDNLKTHCQAITPVPGGVGPMTIAMLLSNTLKSYNQRVQCPS